jgi:hypothetical protein
MEDNQLIFCIGYNKSGTTSLYQAIIDMGFEGYTNDMMANAEYLMKDVIVEQLLHQPYSVEFNVVYDWVEECKLKTQKPSFDQSFLKHMNVFKDVPLSLPGAWRKLYKKYPNAKYILTERDSADQWFKSISRFHQEGFDFGPGKHSHQLVMNHSKDTQTTWKDLSKVKYRFNSYLYDCMMYLNTHGFTKTKSEFPYDNQLKDSYILHNKEVKDFFKNNDNFISVNVARDSDYLKLCSFFNKEPRNPINNKLRYKFPRLKITKDPSTWDIGKLT